MEKTIEQIANDKFKAVAKLEATSSALDDITRALVVVTTFIRDQHNADHLKPITCYNLVTFIQSYNVILELAVDKLNNISLDLQETVDKLYKE